MKVFNWYKSLKRGQADKYWEKFIGEIQNDIENKKLTINGYEAAINDVILFNKKYGLDYEKYVELSKLSQSISDLIYNGLYVHAFNIRDVKHLTTYIIRKDYQKALFDFDCVFDSITSPEYFFEKNFWDKIVTNNLFVNASNMAHFKLWTKHSFFLPVKKKTLDDCKNVNCCGYFLTFFTLSFILKLEPQLGYTKYMEIIEEFKDIPEIIFLFRYTMFLVLRNLNSVNCTYFGQHNSLESYAEVLEQFKNEHNNWFKINISNFSKKFHSSFKNTLVRIVYDNCKDSRNEICNAECTLASMILGESLGDDEEWQKNINKIEEICEEVFI